MSNSKRQSQSRIGVTSKGVKLDDEREHGKPVS